MSEPRNAGYGEAFDTLFPYIPSDDDMPMSLSDQAACFEMMAKLQGDGASYPEAARVVTDALKDIVHTKRTLEDVITVEDLHA